MRRNPVSLSGRVLSVLTFSLLLTPATSAQSVPNGYPASYAATIDGAKK